MTKIFFSTTISVHTYYVLEVTKMPFGYSREIFKYPAVQYIPLDLYNESFFPLNIASNNIKLYLYTETENEELRRRLRSLEIDENHNIATENIGILLLNGKIELIKYRSREVTMVGRPKPGKYHLFSITSKYFYKDRLIFTLYDGVSNERLALIRY